MSNEILQVDDAALARERKAEPQTHRKPTGFSDHFAYGFTRLLRFCADTFFAKRYGHRAIVLETVAAVPGMVGATVTHLKCLRRMVDDEGWIRTLMEEAENERMHLMTFIEVAKPNLFERLVIMTVQWVFYVGFFLLYLVSSRTAHRVVGYFEEEAVVSYTLYLKEIDDGHADNVPAPPIARHYWQLPDDATLRDVVEVVRQDEQHHRDVNHGFADLLDGKTVDPNAHTPYPEHSASLAPEELPRALPYKSTPIFDEQTLPKALRNEHKTKAGVWGGVRVLEGKLQLEFGDGQSSQLVTPENPGLLAPEQPHWVTPIGPMRMQVDFYENRPNLEQG